MKKLMTLVLILVAVDVFGQLQYVNGNLSTGPTAKNGTAAPAGYTWSELQNNSGNTTESNTNLGFGASIANGSALADDFTVPVGQTWTINKFTFYAYSTNYTGTTSPFTDLRMRIHRSSPLAGATTIVFGDLTTNRLTATSDALMYRVGNTAVPTPGTTNTNRRIWKLEANISLQLSGGTYWVEWQSNPGTLTSNFTPGSTVVGARTQPGYNAIQKTGATGATGGTWAALIDAGNPAAAPDVAMDMPFIIDYNAPLPCATGLSPANNAVNVSSTSGLSWAPVVGAASYVVYLGTTSNPSLVANVTSTTFAFSPALSPGTQYYYRIVPQTASGTLSTNCSTLSFTTLGCTNLSLSSPLDAGTVCSNSLFSYNPTSTTPGVSFSWSRAAVAGISNPPASGVGAINERLVNTTSNPINVTYVYTLTSGNCTRTQNVVVVVNPGFTIDLFPQDTIRLCGTSYTLDAGPGYVAYRWNTGATTPSISVVQGRWYKVSVTASNGCSASDSVYVDMFAANIVNNDTTICTGSSLSLSATASTSNVLLDIDGNVYPQVVIGRQIWTQKNLTARRYNNGEAIPQITDATQWSSTTEGAWCWYNNDSARYESTYGKLYNWLTVVDNRNLAPEGWRVPTDWDWITLTNFLGGLSIAGGKMKEVGLSNWETPNTGATNESRFTGLPGGCRNYFGTFECLVGKVGAWWSSTENAPGGNFGYQRTVDNASSMVTYSGLGKLTGISVRLISNRPVSYRWSTGATTPTINVSPTQSATYYVTVSNGISSCTDSVRVNVTNVNRNFFPQDTIKACGTSVTLDAGAGNSYSWSTGATTRTINVATTGRYRCTVTTNNCTASDSVFVSLVNANIVNNDTTICSGSRVTLTAASTSGGATGASLPANLRNGLVGYWPFNGNANDESGTGNNGLVNGAILAADRFGIQRRAYTFNGINNWIQTAQDGVLGSNPRTLSFWMKTTETTASDGMAAVSWGGGQGNLTGARFDGFFNFNAVGATANIAGAAITYSTPAPVNDNNWNHYIFSLNNTSGSLQDIKVYQNGILLNNLLAQYGLPSTPLNTSAGSPILFGKTGYIGIPAFFKGSLDDILIWNRGLSASEINQVLNLLPPTTYRWSTGDTTATINVSPTQSTTYYVTVSNGISICTDSVRVSVTNVNRNFFPQDTIKACGTSVTLDAGIGNSYSWNTGATTRTINVTATGRYRCTVTTNNCTASDSVFVSLVNANIINNDTTICSGSRVTLTAASTSGGATGASLPANLRNGLVGYWPFNGNANDESGNGNNGTSVGAILTSDRFGNSNKAYKFNGLNFTRIQVANNPNNSLNLVNDLSISSWFKADSMNDFNSTVRSIVMKSGDGVGSSNGYAYGIWAGTPISTPSIGIVNFQAQPFNNAMTYPTGNSGNVTINQWYNFVVTYRKSDSSLRYYINGILIDSKALKFEIGNNNNELWIGSQPSIYTTTKTFKGALDDIAIWNRALNPAEISQLYGATTYRWSTGDTTASINVSPSQSTTYYVTVSNGISSCRDSVRVNVNSCNNVFIQAGTRSICGPASITPNTTIDVPVTVRNFRSMVTLQGTVQWDSTVLRYQSVTNLAPGLGLSASNFNSPAANTLLFSWLDNNVTGINLPDSSVLFNIRYTPAANSWNRSTAIEFVSNPNPLEAYRAPADLITVVPTAGRVSIGSRPLNDTVRLSGCGTVRYNTTNYTVSTAFNDTLRTAARCDSINRRVIITVNPIAAISSVLSNSPVILGDTIRLTVNGQNLTGGSFDWSGPNNFRSSLQSPTLVATAAAGGQYRVIFSSICRNDTQTVIVVINAGISGRIISPLRNPVSRVNLRVNNTTTLVTGSYRVGVPTTSSTVIRASKNNDVNKTNGVTVIDVVLIQDHILRRNLLNAPYKIIAADANRSGSVSTGDVLFLRRLILGLDTTLPGNQLWSFVDSSYTFPNPTNPFPYKDSLSFTPANLQTNRTNQTFIGMKLGDVNYDWNYLQLRPVPTEDITLYHDDVQPEGNTIRIPIKVKNLKDLLGMQFTLQYNSSALRFRTIENNRLNLKYGNTRSGEGLLSFIWSDDQNRSVTLNDDAVLMELVFDKTGEFSSEDIQLVNTIAPIEAWDKNYRKHNIIKGRGRILNNTKPGTPGWTVSPNPSTGQVVVNITLQKAQTVELYLTSPDGRVLKSWKQAFAAGTSAWSLDLKSGGFLPAGMYWLKMPGVDAVVRKIVIE